MAGFLRRGIAPLAWVASGWYSFGPIRGSVRVGELPPLHNLTSVSCGVIVLLRGVSNCVFMGPLCVRTVLRV